MSATMSQTMNTHSKGLPLIAVLRDFMKDATNVVSHGGTNEMRRAGLNDLHVSWKAIANQGFCTMYPDVDD